MKNSVTVLAVFMLAAISVPSAQAAPYLSASTFGHSMEGWSAGGSGTTALAHSDSSEGSEWFQGNMYLDWTLSVDFQASVAQGKMGADLLSHTLAPRAGRTGPYAGVDAWMTDYFHIDAGDTGLPTGAEVQIRFMSGFAGYIDLDGSPNGGAYVHYDSYLSRPTEGTLAHLNTDTDVFPAITSLYPLVAQNVDVSISQIINVHIGDVLQVYSFFSMDLNGSAYGGTAYGYPYDEGDNDLGFLDTGYTRIGYAPGYEDLGIWSDGGAMIVPEPATIALFGLGALSLIRTKKRA